MQAKHWIWALVFCLLVTFYKQIKEAQRHTDTHFHSHIYTSLLQEVIFLIMTFFFLLCQFFMLLPMHDEEKEMGSFFLLNSWSQFLIFYGFALLRFFIFFSFPFFGLVFTLQLLVYCFICFFLFLFFLLLCFFLYAYFLDGKNERAVLSLKITMFTGRLLMKKKAKKKK